MKHPIHHPESTSAVASKLSEIGEVKVYIHEQINASKTELKGEIKDVRTEIKDVRTEIKDVRKDIKDLEQSIRRDLKWFAGIIIAFVIAAITTL